MTDILQKERMELRKKAERVDFKKISKDELEETVRLMKEALNSQDDGVAIAAPQIGISSRIFVVSEKIFELTKRKKLDHGLTFINPTITKRSREKQLVEEGCLSVRWLYGKVNRSSKVTLEAYDIHGKKFVVGATGLLAQIFQHETDHLEGVLFIDKAIDVEEILPEEMETHEKRTA